MKPIHQGIYLVEGVVESERCAHRGGNTKVVHDGLRTVVPGPNRYAFLIENRPDVMWVRGLHYQT